MMTAKAKIEADIGDDAGDGEVDEVIASQVS